jgi:BolA protein
MNRIELIRAALEKSLQPELLNITDDSHQHAGHAGAATGRGHFSVEIISATFSGQMLIQRHRLVYAALGELMQTDIHALSIQALAPGELQSDKSEQSS